MRLSANLVIINLTYITTKFTYNYAVTYTIMCFYRNLDIHRSLFSEIFYSFKPENYNIKKTKTFSYNTCSNPMRKKKILPVLVAVIVFATLIMSGKNSAGMVSDNKYMALTADRYNAGKNDLPEDGANIFPTVEYDTYSNPDLGISFSKPSNWNVFIADGTIYIKPSIDSPTGIFLTPILRAHIKMQALSFIWFVYERAKTVYPDLVLSDKKANSNNTMAEVSALFTKNNTPVTGFYMVSIDNGRGLFCGYEDIKNNFDGSYAALKQVLKTLNVGPQTFYNGTSKGQVYGGSAAAKNNLSPTIDPDRFVTKALSDGSMYIRCPSDWQADGGNYFFAAHSPDGKMGVFTSNDHQPRTFDPKTYLLSQLMPFMKCSNTTITKVEANNDYMKLLQSQGIPSNASNFYGETTTLEGLRLSYGIMLSASNMQGLGAADGYVTSYGAFAEPKLLDRNFNVLVAMALSITADNSVIMGNMRANLDRLNAVSKTISQTSDVTISMVRGSSANTDRVIDKYNYYLSGEEARYSPLENKIYVVDSNLAAYASNPNYQNEMLTNVPDSKWNTLSHDRTYAP